MRECKLDTAGENVAYGYRTGKSVVNDGWMNSEGHRANILSPSFKLMGIGARKGHDGRWYVSQVFGRKPDRLGQAGPANRNRSFAHRTKHAENLAAGIVLAALSSATALVSADAATSNPDARRQGRRYQVNASVNKSEPMLNRR